jgi:hypothetical protein
MKLLAFIMRFEVFKVKIPIVMLKIMMSCSLVGGYQCFRNFYHEDGEDRFP